MKMKKLTAMGMAALMAATMIPAEYPGNLQH